MDLDALLTARVRRTSPGPALAGRAGTLVLDAGMAGQWTVLVAGGRVTARRGPHATPTTTVRGTPDVLARIVDGQLSGVEAFLDGRVTVRGDLSFSLQLDGLLDLSHADTTLPRSHAATVLGIRTTYLEAGPRDAPPVLLLHGLGATNASMLPTLWDLARDHHVIAPDLPGHGATAAPRAPYTARWLARWLTALQAEIGLGPAGIVGNSLGGRLALEAALQDPAGERVTSVVLLCPSPAFRRLRQWVPIVRLLRPELAALPLRTSHRFVVEAVRSMFSVPDRLAPAWYDAAADEFLRVFADRAHRVAFFAVARQIYLEQAYGERGFWTRLPQLAAPATFVWGERDRLVPASYARHVEELLPHACSVVLRDCGHVPQFELPEQTAALVRDGLARGQTAARRSS